MKELTCPICGKHGIPDFYSQDVVCPCCGSDLSIYRLVNQIEAGAQPKPTVEKKPGRSAAVYAFASAVAVLLLFSGVLLTKLLHYGDELKSSEARCEALVTENEALKATVSGYEAQSQTPLESPSFRYVVREGDSFWVISRKLYGTGTRYKEIAQANNLDVEAVLNIGDQLIIRQ